MVQQVTNYDEMQEIMKGIQSEALRNELDQVIMFFRMIDCQVEAKLESGSGEKSKTTFTVYFSKGEENFCMIMFMTKDNETSFSSMEIVGNKYRDLHNEFLTEEHRGMVSRRLGGVRVTSTEDKMVEVLRRVQILHM